MDDTERARSVIERLSFPRESASAAERRAAEIVAGALGEAGAPARLEAELVHGTHWWPFGLPAAASLGAGLSGRRLPAVIAGVLGAASVLDDAGGGPALLRRRLLPQRTTWNVVCELGDPSAVRRLIVCSHHDSAHGGITFEEPLATLFARGSTRQTFAQIAGGPALVALGALTGRRPLLRAGLGLSALTTALMTDIARRGAVPGANDNAAGCAALVLLARRLVVDPPTGLRVTLLSTGSEESWVEGMRAYWERHAAELDPRSTVVLCLDSIGFSKLSLRDVEEDALRAHRTPSWLADLVVDAATGAAVTLERGFPGAFPTDALIAHQRGVPAATLVSFDEHGRMPGYHTDRDTPEQVHLPSVLAAAHVAEAVAHRLSKSSVALPVPEHG
ncbi:MAG: M28 family peptidase [Baekduia sp.]